MIVSPLTAADYVIDHKGGHASINFKIKHLGYSWLTGRFDKFTGHFSYDEKKPAEAKISVWIDVGSINSNHAERDKHLRGQKFLDVANHPKAMFVSTRIEPTGDGQAVVHGRFTLRGVTKEISFAVHHIGGGKDPWGGFRRGFSGATKIALTDYGIPYNLGPASKELELSLHIEGIRQ